ncbi:hypothetical protein [Devosia sp. CN2-171]|jgi:hypothetical protein|uniref:hypothetical protein n=1 Tax=Devosia sp. CN2-171 TaxID=3400909 RepID=UPI003BF8A59B
MHEKTTQRTRSAGAVANQQARAILAPLVPMFSRWNLAAARLAAKQASRLSTETELLLVVQQKRALAAEIRRAMDQLHAALAGEPANPRIADLETSFRRLLEMLSE